MKMKLFYLSLDCGSDRHIVQVVAPDAGMAVEFFRENLNDLGSEMGEPSILRIDQTLTGDERLGLDAMLEHVQHNGPSWRVPAHRKDHAEVDPTHAWSRRLPDGRVGIEMVVFQEYEELVAVLRPAALRPGIRSLRRV